MISSWLYGFKFYLMLLAPPTRLYALESWHWIVPYFSLSLFYAFSNRLFWWKHANLSWWPAGKFRVEQVKLLRVHYSTSFPSDCQNYLEPAGGNLLKCKYKTDYHWITFEHLNRNLITLVKKKAWTCNLQIAQLKY